ncbi:MAG: spiro-SPASM protein, partial [Spirochaetaceae bacterium]
MKNIAVLNGTSLSAFSQANLPGGKNAFECAIEFAKNLPDVQKVLVLLSAPRKESAGCDVSVEKEWSTAMVLESIAGASKNSDNIFYFYADTPLLDPGLAQRMYENHIKYFAEYTFADGFPQGLSVEILKPHILEPLIKLSRKEDKVTRDMFFEIIKRDINSFDLETELSAVDLRILRLTLAADNKSNTEILNRVMGTGARSETEVLELVQKKPELLRAYPAYYQLQIVEGCAQSCSYCPYPKVIKDVIGKKQEMKTDQILAFAKKALDFSGECTISLSLWGEPGLHSQIADVIKTLLDMDGLDIVIETSGLGWDSAAIKSL